MHSSFKYRPLSISSNEIRLIRILPGSDPEELHCLIGHVSMDEDPSYNALSYAWQEPAVFSPEELSSTEVLVVHTDGQRLSGKTTSRGSFLEEIFPCLKIGKNLAAFLHSARSSERASGLLWVDAICIDQQDTKERNVQVQRMRDIYKNASEVLVWLGPEGLDSGLAFEHIRMLYRIGQADEGDQAASRVVDGSVSWSEDAIIRLKNSIKAGNHILGWKAFSKLLDRSWWTRIWVTQEVVVATKVAVICGPCKLEWQVLEFVLYNLVQNWGWMQNLSLCNELSSVFVESNGMRSARGIRDLREWNDFYDFLRVLYKTYTKSCSDMRDKVYGVLGIASDTQDIIPSPDYSLSAIDVYKKLSVSMINVRGNLDYLLLVGNLPLGEQRDPSIPSWCPDLSRVRKIIPMNSSVGGAPRQVPRPFQAAGVSRPIIDFQAQLGTLTLKGFCLDIIDGLGVGWSSFNDFSKAVVQPCFQASNYRTVEDTYYAIWITIVAAKNTAKAEKHPHALDPFSKLFARQCCSLEGSRRERTICEPPSNAVESSDTHTSRSFDKWYFRNRSIIFGGKTLQSWAESFDPGQNDSGGAVHPTQHELWPTFEFSFMDTNYDRRIVTTEKGYFGMAPEQTSRGDIVCILLGGRMPVILRPVEQHWEFVGECFIHGVMYGESMSGLENGMYKLQDFELH